MFVLIRILIGLIFVVSGGEKLIWPYQNFLYVLQGYQIFARGFDELTAHVFPWIEFILGLMLVLGLWLPVVLRGILVMLAGFILIVSQAIIRQLPLGECGCFGELISFPLHVVVLMDSVLFLLCVVALWKIDQTRVFGLDRYFEKNS